MRLRSRSAHAGRLGPLAMTVARAAAPSTRSWRSWFTPTVARLAALIGLVVLFSFVSPFFLTTGNLVNVMQNAVVVGIVAAPLTLLLVARQVDLSVGSAVAFAATCFTLLARDVGIGVAIPAAFAAALLVAAINAFAITTLRVNSIITTLGTLLAFRGLTKILGAGSNIPVERLRAHRSRAHRDRGHRGADLGLHPPRRSWWSSGRS